MSAEDVVMPIAVVVVESHQHVLEHIHHILRRKRLLGKDWSMLHFDAHPDLAVPNNTVPAAACYQPRKTWSKDDSSTEGDKNDLYELLDSTSTGIAEWILPLVLAANLTKVDWFRQQKHSVKQFPLGEHRYNVGVWIPEKDRTSSTVDSFLDLPESARVKVDWDCPYYYDDEDDSVAPIDELVLTKPLFLRVLEFEESNLCQDEDNAVPWMLDICLDYFECLNPFAVDIERLDPMFADCLMASVLHSSLYTQTGAEEPTPSTRKHRISSFRSLLTQLLQVSMQDDYDTNKVNEILTAMKDYYETHDRAETLLSSLLDSLHSHEKKDRQPLVELAVEAIPHLTMPHDSSLLAEPPFLPEQIDPPSLQVVRNELDRRRCCIDNNRDNSSLTTFPFVISIARSSIDGFTPASLVDDLQERVLATVHSCYCSCPRTVFTPESNSNCRLRIAFDYGQWEGSTLHFS